jgi:hypothetical protein
MHRALPGRTIDLIRDGVPARDLRAMGDAMVRRALLSTAASAMQCGWTDIDWSSEILHARSRLGHQVRVARDGRRQLTKREVQHRLDEAWDRATEYVSNTPAWDRDTMRADAEDRARRAREIAADPGADLTDAMRAVLVHAADLADKWGLHRLTLPGRAVADATGLSHKAARTALAALHETDLLRLEDRGRGGADVTKRRAARYRLLPHGGAQRSFRGTRPLCPQAPAQTSVPPAPAQTSVPPAQDAPTADDPGPTQPEEMAMPTAHPDTESVTVTATSSVSGPPAAVADLLHRLQAAGVIDDTGQVDPAVLATVLPLPVRASS